MKQADRDIIGLLGEIRDGGGGGSGGGAFIPNTTNLIKGSGSGDGADSGIVPANVVQTTRTVNGHALSANVTVSKGDVGLGNVDNTSDASKPVSTSTQTALDLKADKTVATKYRIKTDGTFQLYNPTTSKYHTLSLSGADGAVVMAFGTGEA